MQSGYLSKDHSIILVLLFLVVLLVSGCTWPGTTTTGGAGVVVKEFGPEFSEIYSQEPVTFRLLMRNEGSVDAKNVYAELLGLDEAWCQGTLCDTSRGGIQEKLPNEEDCKYPGQGSTMLAPDPQRGTSGSQKTCTWTYNGPKIEKGFTISYTPSVRIYSSYTSGVVKLITFGSSSELRIIQDKGGTLPAETKSQTNTPIMLDIQTQGPIRFWTGNVAFPLEITIKNVGGGVACAKESTDQSKSCKEAASIQAGADLKNRIYVKITLPEQTTFSETACQAFTGGKIISLWKGQTNTIVCNAQASNLGSGSTTQKLIKAEAYYEYYIDKDTSIKVIGRETSSSGSGGIGI